MASEARDDHSTESMAAEVVAEVPAENAERDVGKDLQEVTASIKQLLDGALAVEEAAGEKENSAARALLAGAATASAATATERLARVQAALDRTWEKLNTGHWSAVPLAHRRFFAFASLHKVWLVLLERSADAATALRAALAAADRGLLLGAPLPFAGGECALAVAATALSGALSRLQPAPAPAGEAAQEGKKLFSSQMVSVTPPSTCVSARKIPTLHQPSLERFAKDHFTPCLPVHLAGAANHWPARKRWCSLEYLCRVAGARTVPVELGAHYVDPNWAQKLMTLETFVKKHVENHKQNLGAEDKNQNNVELGYLAQHPLFDQVPELRADICIPEYCCLSEDPDDPLDPDINAWFGPAGTVSPLHFDPKHNLLTQVVGSKRVLLYAPEESASLYPHEGTLLNNTAQVDPENPDYKKFPAFQKAEAWECTLHPGDMLYIPPRWWHHVRSLSISFSVSFWWK